jgi:transcriptional regulator with XRE-family HTH domain
MASDERRREIAQFLRRRRQRLSPEEVGLAARGRRRTPGLRREDVAELAGISTEWYAWLEQARDVRPSLDTLTRIAAALRLDPAQARHLLALAEHGQAGSQAVAPPAERLPEHLCLLMRQLEPYPAWIRNDRWDVLGWNQATELVYGDFAARAPADRNMLCLMFLDPRARTLLPQWSEVAPRVVAKVRSAYARYVGDPWYHEVLDRVLQGSPEFAAAWADYDVQPYEDDLKVFEVEGLGRLTFRYTELAVRDDRAPGLTLVTYVPDSAGDTLQRLRQGVALPG